MKGRSASGATPFHFFKKVTGRTLYNYQRIPILLSLGRRRGPKRQGRVETGPWLGWQANPLQAYIISPGALVEKVRGPGTLNTGKWGCWSPCRGFLRVSQIPPCLKTASAKNKASVIVIGDSLLKWTEGPICWPDPTQTEAWCLPQVQVRDVTRKLLSQVWSSDYYILPIVKVVSAEVVGRNPRAIKRDCRALGWLAEGVGTQVVFSLIL